MVERPARITPDLKQWFIDFFIGVLLPSAGKTRTAAKNYQGTLNVLLGEAPSVGAAEKTWFARVSALIIRRLQLQFGRGMKMTAPSPQPLTQLLLAWRRGDQAALERLVPLVYNELRSLARRYMAGQKPGHTLQASALVNEAYMRLINCQLVNWKDRAHFLAVAAQMMRRVLVESA